MEETLLTKANATSFEETYNTVEYATKYKAKDGEDKWNRHHFRIDQPPVDDPIYS